MNWTRVAGVVLRQFYLYAGSPQRILPIFAWVVVDIVLWGFITRYLNSIANAGIDFVPALLGAVLLWDFLARVMQGVAMAFLEDVWSRNFLNFFATPLRMSEYLAGLVIIGFTTSLIGLVVMMIVAWAAFGLSFLAYGITLLPFLVILLLSGVGFGIASAAVVLRLGPASEWLVWPIPTLVSPFAGVFYPVTVLPLAMQLVSAVLPPAYVFQGVRDTVAGASVAWSGLAFGSALALAYVALACALFAAVYRYAMRTGLIARYSAETAS
jgi:ABC-2 type transport system permease protein